VGRGERERGREGYLGVLIRCFVVSGSERDVVALHLCTPHLVEIRAILLSRPSATLFFSVSTLSYTVLSLFISLCTPSYEPCRHNLSSRPIHILLDHYHFFPLACLFYYLLVRFLPRLSLYHMATTVRQPKPTKKGFPGDNPSNRSVLPPFPIHLFR
jgi:hypothetical protein